MVRVEVIMWLRLGNEITPGQTGAETDSMGMSTVAATAMGVCTL